MATTVRVRPPDRLRLRLPVPGPLLALMLLVLGVYLLATSGHTYSPDEETMLAASQSLVVDGSWALPPSRALVEVTGSDGRRYSQYGPGQSLAMLAWVVVGRALGGLFAPGQSGFALRFVLGTYNALIAAAACALLAAIGIALGYSRRAALSVGATLAFGTFLWPHSRTLFSEPLVALALLGSFYLLARPGGRAAGYALSGALFALAVATKAQYAIALPAFALYAGRFALMTRGAGGEKARRVAGLRWLVWATGLLAGLIPLLVYNLTIFGNPLTTGYGGNIEGTFRTPVYEGAFGLLLSPGKGIIWYALPLALALWGVPRFFARHPSEGAFIAALAVLIVGFFGAYSFWSGDGSWGPRYLVPLLPFLMLPALEAFSVVPVAQGGVNWRALAVSSVVGAGVAVSLLGVLVNFDTYINVANDDTTRHWYPPFSPIPGHAALLNSRLLEWSARLNPAPGTVFITSGFSYSEGDRTRGDLLPRWATGEGRLDIVPRGSEPLSITLRLADHRPPTLPRARVQIVANGSRVNAGVAPVKDRPASVDYVFSIPPVRSSILVQSDTWNPTSVGTNERDEKLGIMLERVSVTEDGRRQAYRLVNALGVPTYYPQPRWYYDPSTHHPADLWPVYLVSAEMGRKGALLLGLPLMLLSLGCLYFAARGLRA